MASRSGLRRFIDLVGIALVVAALLFGLWWQSGGQRFLDSPHFREVLRAPASLEPTLATDSDTSSVPAQKFGFLGAPPPPRHTYPHLDVTGKGETKTATHTFTFDGKKHTIAVKVDMALYDAAEQSTRRISYPLGETEQDQWAAYYRYMAQDQKQAPLIADVAKQLRAIAEREDYSRSRYAEMISKYVQTMPYDFKKLKANDTGVRFPVQTLVDGTGICSDKSVLMCALLAYEGYDVSLLLFEAENHMAVGIKGPGKEYKDSAYLFDESTAPTYLSEVPQDFVSGVHLTSDPFVIPIGEGDRQYKTADDVARILNVRESAEPAAKELYRQASSQRLTKSGADAVNRKLRTAYAAQYRLQWVDGYESKFLDRVSALRWIDANAWWD